MSRTFGFRAYTEIYSNVILYGPRPINSSAANGMGRKKKGTEYNCPSRKETVLRRRKNRLIDEGKGGSLIAVNGTTRVYLVKKGTLSSR